MISPTYSPLLLYIFLWVPHGICAKDGYDWATRSKTPSFKKSASRLSAVPSPKLLGSLFNRPTEMGTDRPSKKRSQRVKEAKHSLPSGGAVAENLARSVGEFRRDVCRAGEGIRTRIVERADEIQIIGRRIVSGIRRGLKRHDAAVEGRRLASRARVRSSLKGKTALREENDACVETIMALIDSEGWEHVTRKMGVTVVKKFMPPAAEAEAEAEAGRGLEGKQDVVDAKAAAKFACVKASGTLYADALEVYKLFLGNERVHEYNDNCRQVKDLEWLSPDTKITWAASPSYGPFKARDFVTIVHYRTLPDGTRVVVNRPVEHESARRGKKYVRAEILVASNIMRPNPRDPSKTDFISVTHINPGGIVDSAIGAKITNALCAQAPVKLLTSLEKTANAPAADK